MAGRSDAGGETPDLTAELKRLGRQLGETIGRVWNSAERQRFEEEVRSGARAFADEIEQAVRKTRDASPSEVTGKARRAAAEGLRRMSIELEELANRFTPPEGSGEEE